MFVLDLVCDDAAREPHAVGFDGNTVLRDVNPPPIHSPLLAHVDDIPHNHTLAPYMAILRNLLPRMVSFDLPALGTDDHHGGTNSLDPVSGVRGLMPHVRTLPRSITLAACSNPRLPLAKAIEEGSAQDGLPDAVIDDPVVVAKVSRHELSATFSTLPEVHPS